MIQLKCTCKLSNLPSKEEVVDSTLSNLPLIVVTDVFKEAVSNCNLSNLWSKEDVVVSILSNLESSEDVVVSTLSNLESSEDVTPAIVVLFDLLNI